MKKLEELEKVGRQAWLATIGTYAKGWEILSGKVNETFEDTNQLINELVENGEKIETDLKAKIKSNTQLDDKIRALKVKLGVDESFDEKLALLNNKVEQLTIAIEKLVEAKAAKAAKLVEATAVKKESPKPAKEVAAVKKESPKPTKEVAAVKKESPKPAKEVAAIKKESPKPTKEVAAVKKESPKPTKEVAAVKKESPEATKEVTAVKKAPAKRAAVKKESATTKATPAEKPTRTRRTTAKTKAAEVK